ncbi:MAG: segregation/condensation protein A [Thiothrix sp.]|nr:segregation/condensation protein A [Thiothrix sp.]HPE59872.1 ScpA family protein [Thiolinea sp.]
MTVVQKEIPLARVRGEPVSVLPEDLYIPPEALEVILEAFEGPLDLLLYLIRRQNLDICDIPVAEITAQYMVYVEMMKATRLDLAAEYLLMSAMLAEIKSRLLLPRQTTEEEEEDPRAELVRRLQAYEQCKQAAILLDGLPRLERDCWPVRTAADFPLPPRPPPALELRELLLAFQVLLQRAEMLSSHQVRREHLSIRERMTRILGMLQVRPQAPFSDLFTLTEGRRGLVVTLMALLELLKARLIEVVQSGEEPYAPLFVCVAAGELPVPAVPPSGDQG